MVLDSTTIPIITMKEEIDTITMAIGEIETMTVKGGDPMILGGMIIIIIGGMNVLIEVLGGTITKYIVMILGRTTTMTTTTTTILTTTIMTTTIDHLQAMLYLIGNPPFLRVMKRILPYHLRTPISSKKSKLEINSYVFLSEK